MKPPSRGELIVFGVILTLFLCATVTVIGVMAFEASGGRFVFAIGF
ncbi:MAG: hypothetical protein AAF846_11175 [Chloroflexota bacterium]